MKIRASPRRPSRKSCRPDAGVATGQESTSRRVGSMGSPPLGGPRQSLEQQIRIIRVTTPAEYPRELVQDVKLRDGSYIHIRPIRDRKSTRLNSSHVRISYAVFCLKKKKM